MNLFTQYGIKEVANVTLYSIIKIGDEEFYLPALYLNTLKISNLEEKASKVTAASGYGNRKVLAWNFGKDVTIKIKDALFTPASLSLMWGGYLNQNFTKFTYTILKLTMVLKYYRLHYSPYAYQSPKLTDDELEILYYAATLCADRGSTAAAQLDIGKCWVAKYKKTEPKVEEYRTKLRKLYYNRDNNGLVEYFTELQNIIFELITTGKQFSNYTSNLYDVEVIDRFEECIVDQDKFILNLNEQRENIKRYLMNDRSLTYNIYYDNKTLVPLGLEVVNDNSTTYILPKGTTYLKWTRYVKYKEGLDDGSLGKLIVMNTDTFPGYYRLVGETKIREQKTGKDQNIQFVLPRIQLTPETNITLEAAGDPTVFDFSLTVIAPPNDIMVEFKQFDTEKDCVNGGTRIVPQLADFTRTFIDTQEQTQIETHNPYEIY